MSFFGLVVLLVGVVWVARRCTGYPAGPATRAALGRGQAALVDAAAEAMFPAAGAIPVSGREADIAGYLDGLLEALPSGQRRQIAALLFLFEHATLFFPAPGPSLRRFSSLTVPQRVAVLEAWSESSLAPRRLAFSALRALLTMGYLGHPRALLAIGMAPFDFESPVLEADLLYPPIGRGRDAIPWTRADLTPPSQGLPLDPQGPRRPDSGGSGHADPRLQREVPGS